jgi:hypothetical protein
MSEETHMSTPELNTRWIADGLSPWIQWSRRSEFSPLGWMLPGVYLLAHLESLPDTIDPTDERIIYIGETHALDQALKFRWQAFHQGAFKLGNGPHAGGNTYHKTFGASREKELCVSALALKLDPPLRSAFILAAERLLIWQFVLKHGRLPRCNKE